MNIIAIFAFFIFSFFDLKSIAYSINRIFLFDFNKEEKLFSIVSKKKIILFDIFFLFFCLLEIFLLVAIFFALLNIQIIEFKIKIFILLYVLFLIIVYNIIKIYFYAVKERLKYNIEKSETLLDIDDEIKNQYILFSEFYKRNIYILIYIFFLFLIII